MMLGLIGLAALGAVAVEEAQAETMRVFELRTYHTFPGRLEALHKRFREHTNAIFVKHGMSLIGYWTPTEAPDSENTLVYILAYPSMAAREASWKAFRDDPDWQAAREASEKDGKIVEKVESKFLTPTDYSPIR
ncbi:MAG: NIPSNAP family protein [Acidobacteria bacterium]|nr:NIPSNAP family protein [Acidobacteriota bacterium]